MPRRLDADGWGERGIRFKQQIMSLPDDSATPSSCQTDESGNSFYPTLTPVNGMLLEKTVHNRTHPAMPPARRELSVAADNTFRSTSNQPAARSYISPFPVNIHQALHAYSALPPGPCRWLPPGGRCRPCLSIMFLVLLEALAGSVCLCRGDPCLLWPRDASSWLVVFATGPVVASVDHPCVDVRAGVVVLSRIQAVCRAQNVVGILGLPSSVA